jgi:hypothetical protein
MKLLGCPQEEQRFDGGTKGGFDIIKTQSFRATGKTLVATKIDESRRFVAEFNYKPAIEAYAQVLGVSPQ